MGIYTMSDKHIAVSKADLDGLARPGQIVVDSDDYSLWVGNADGELVSAGGGGDSGPSTVGPTGALQFVGGEGELAGVAELTYDPVYNQLTTTGDFSALSVSAENYVGSRAMVSGRYIEAGAEVTDGTTLDLSMGCYFKLTVTGPVTLDLLSYSIEGPFASRFTMEIIGGGTDITWWPGAKWEGGVAPVLSSNTDIIEFITTDGGASTIGIVKATNVS
jgi:hypothetical protein